MLPILLSSVGAQPSSKLIFSVCPSEVTTVENLSEASENEQLFRSTRPLKTTASPPPG